MSDSASLVRVINASLNVSQVLRPSARIFKPRASGAFFGPSLIVEPRAVWTGHSLLMARCASMWAHAAYIAPLATD